MAPSKTTKGKTAEDLAVSYLKKRGMKVLLRNYHAKGGELDIIGREGNTLCVVEVRSRGVSSPHSPEADISHAKVRRISRATRQLLKHYKLDAVPVRTDLLVVDYSTGAAEVRFHPGGIVPIVPG